MSPALVRTPTTRPFFWITPYADTPSQIFAPCMRAPLPSAIVTSTGFARPSSFT